MNKKYFLITLCLLLNINSIGYAVNHISYNEDTITLELCDHKTVWNYVIVSYWQEVLDFLETLDEETANAVKIVSTTKFYIIYPEKESFNCVPMEQDDTNVLE